ncbi:DUF5634 family protein [Sediminibacillus albus]|uniref:GK1464-like domain-containing protein n=1 Tax=Sediminibacillus albus TaxID=407036 RepID=A0A1G8Y2J0_9BACI|nr:DUF5634 family protein [Sediminibacillus albus]SDJ97006.1 hypothetical protein SAMN05216243_1369 [Sediminibacillus albus]
MENVSIDQIMNDLQESFRPLMDKYDIDDIGTFEEEGQDQHYYVGYTVRKDGRVYMVHMPFTKNADGQLSLARQEWTVETDDPTDEDLGGFPTIDAVFEHLFK